MTNIQKRFYKGRVALNVLANNIENAKDIFEAAEGYVVVGVLSKRLSNSRRSCYSYESIWKRN